MMKTQKRIVSLLCLPFFLLPITAVEANFHLEADSAFKRFQQIETLFYNQKYNEIIHLCQNENYDKCQYEFYSTLPLLTFSYFEVNKKNDGLHLLELLVKRKGQNSVENLKFNFASYKLDNLPRYKFILKNFDSLFASCEDNLDKLLTAECENIINSDQAIRNEIAKENLVAKHTNVDSLLNLQDSINAKKIELLICSLGHFPGIVEIGPQVVSQMLFILGHLEAFLNVPNLFHHLILAHHKRQIPNYYIPLLIDLWRLKRDKKQIFGMIKIELFPVSIENIEFVDSRRSVFSLRPIWWEAKRDKEMPLPEGYTSDNQKIGIGLWTF